MTTILESPQWYKDIQFTKSRNSELLSHIQSRIAAYEARQIEMQSLAPSERYKIAGDLGIERIRIIALMDEYRAAEDSRLEALGAMMKLHGIERIPVGW